MDKGSKFLAYLIPVTSEVEGQAFLNTLKKSHPKARHFCSALRLGPDASIERSNDDGEPSGSAGKPILGQLIKNQLTNVVVVVVRYFGGTKLGIPGLIEAYKSSTAEAIGHAKIIEQSVYAAYQIELKYDLLPSFKNHVLQAGVPLLEELFNETAKLKIGFRSSTANEDLMKMLNEFSHRDFDTLDAYCRYLEIDIADLKEELVI